MSHSNPNYFRLGLFVLAAVGALIALILIFGSGQLFQKTFEVETYIKQSVTGLDNGASVRFRGVKVGQVISVGLTGDIYERARGIPCLTTLSAGVSAARAIASAQREGVPDVLSLQELHRSLEGAH